MESISVDGMAREHQHVAASSAGSDWLRAIDICTYTELPFDVASSNYSNYRHAAHCMIYAFDSALLWNEVKVYANVMMQVRFDGTFGFPGGLIDMSDCSIVDGLNRELVEEINLDLNCYRVSQEDHIASHVSTDKEIVTHFYALQVTMEQHHSIEQAVLHAYEWGKETMGVLRVPLYTLEDGVRGFPMFLTGKFVGNSLEQLLTTIQRRNIMLPEDLQRAVSKYKTLMTVCG